MTSSPTPHRFAADLAAACVHTYPDVLPGPVGADRIALVRRRIALGRYPVDGPALASELLAYRAGPAQETSEAAGALLATAIDQLDPALAMTLQLLYCEQLGPLGTAQVMGWHSGQVEAARQAALIRLTILLNAAGSGLMPPRAAST